MKLILSSVGNPDHNQNPNKSMFGCEPNKEITVSSFKEASEKSRAFINKNGLGAGNWSGGDVIDEETGNIIARVSYNGRVWNGKTEIKI